MSIIHSREYYCRFSKILDRDMQFLRFGNYGPATIVFPTSCGRFFDFENNGAINVLSDLLNNRQLQIICVDSIDQEHLYKSWYSSTQRLDALNAYYDYITQEVQPWIQNEIGAYEDLTLMGCSLGGYHAANVAINGRRIKNVVAFGSSFKIKSIVHDPFYRLTSSFMFDEAPQLNKKIKFDLYCGDQDELLGNNKQMHSLLQSNNRVSTLITITGGHDWPTWLQLIKKHFQME